MQYHPVGTSAVTTVVVTGPPRSGTTLLANLLSGGNAHPLLPECQVITDLMRQRLRSEQELDPTKFRVFLQDNDFADSVYRAAIESILSEILIRSNSAAKYIVLKDPHLVQFLDVIDRMIPWSPKKICIVRDPRDTIASYINVCLRQGYRPPIEQSVEFMTPFFTGLMAQCGKDVLTIRYEDLVRKCSVTQNILSQHVGYPIDIASYSGIPDEILDTTDVWCTYLYGKAVDTESIGLFERVISWEEYHLINDSFREVLEKFYCTSKELA